MAREIARIEVNQFESRGEQLISWNVHCSFNDHESGGHWQSSAGVIATVAEAEAFVEKLNKAIEEAKAAQSAKPVTVDGEIKAAE